MPFSPPSYVTFDEDPLMGRTGSVFILRFRVSDLRCLCLSDEEPPPIASLFVATSYQGCQVLHQHEEAIRVLLDRHEAISLVEPRRFSVLSVHKHSSPSDVVGCGRIEALHRIEPGRG